MKKGTKILIGTIIVFIIIVGGIGVKIRNDEHTTMVHHLDDLYAKLLTKYNSCADRNHFLFNNSVTLTDARDSLETRCKSAEEEAFNCLIQRDYVMKAECGMLYKYMCDPEVAEVKRLGEINFGLQEELTEAQRVIKSYY